METVVLVIHLMLALAIIGLVLLQRSEGGGLGIGGGGGLGGLATPQATANALTKATAVCAALFFATSLTLGVMAEKHSSAASILSKIEKAPATQTAEDASWEAEAGKETAPEGQGTENAPEVPVGAPAQEPSVPIAQ